VVLAREGRTAEIPASITLDLSRPRPLIRSVEPATLPARGPREVRIRFRAQVRAAGAELFIYRVAPAGPVLVGTLKAQRGRRVADWNGRLNGRPAPAGRYVFGLRTRDSAGNVGTFPRRLPPTAAVAAGMPGVRILEARRRR
jgi:hypothetical protein